MRLWGVAIQLEATIRVPAAKACDALESSARVGRVVFVGTDGRAGGMCASDYASFRASVLTPSSGLYRSFVARSPH